MGARARRKGGVGGIPPAEPSQFRSDIFKQIPFYFVEASVMTGLVVQKSSLVLDCRFSYFTFERLQDFLTRLSGIVSVGIWEEWCLGKGSRASF